MTRNVGMLITDVIPSIEACSALSVSALHLKYIGKVYMIFRCSEGKVAIDCYHEFTDKSSGETMAELNFSLPTDIPCKTNHLKTYSIGNSKLRIDTLDSIWSLDFDLDHIKKDMEINYSKFRKFYIDLDLSYLKNELKINSQKYHKKLVMPYEFKSKMSFESLEMDKYLKINQLTDTTELMRLGTNQLLNFTYIGVISKNGSIMCHKLLEVELTTTDTNSSVKDAAIANQKSIASLKDIPDELKNILST
jgi:hypothetical protein